MLATMPVAITSSSGNAFSVELKFAEGQGGEGSPRPELSGSPYEQVGAEDYL